MKSKGKEGTRRKEESAVALVRAVNLFGAGEHALAGKAADEAVRLDGGNWQALKLRGLVAVQAGDMASAIRYFEAVLGLCHDGDTVLILGECFWRAGLFERSIDILEAYLQAHPGHAQALFHLGVARAHAGQDAAAEATFRDVALAMPGWVDAWNNLGQVQLRLGKSAEAEASWRKALDVAPPSAPVLYNLASLCFGIPGRQKEALGLLEQGVGLAPTARRCLELAVLMRQTGDIEGALPYYQQALELDPDFAEAYDSLGCLNFEHGNCADAEHLFRTAVSLVPGRADFLVNLGVALHTLGKNEEAESTFRQAIAANPGDARTYNLLAILLAARGSPYEAMEAGRHAIELDPQYQDALVQLAALEGDAGQTDLALDHYRQANAVMRNDAIRILSAMLVPPIMGTREEIEGVRRRVDGALDALLADASLRCSLEDLKLLTESGFYFAFHGFNDRELLAKFSRVLRHACPELDWTSTNACNPPPAGGRLRIGFVSSFFFTHSVGLCFGPVIKALAQRGDMDIFLVSIGQNQALNPMQVELIAACQHFVTVSETSLVAARETIASLQLDVLCYADIGMRTFSNLLAHGRLAPVQCALNGHPDTTGISTVDHYLALVPGRLANAQEHYSEHLIPVKNGGSILWRQNPLDSHCSRAELGLPAEGRLYVCPMKLQKIHPDFDAALSGILATDPEARIILFQDNTYRDWHGMVRDRMALTLSAEQLERVHFQPWIANMGDFIAVNVQADAVLDSFPFGAGTTAIILMQMGVPMVTCPGPFARGQMATDIYDQLGIAELVAESVEQYVAMAVRLAGDKAFRADIARRLVDGYPGISGTDGVANDLVAAFVEMSGRGRPAA